MKLKSFLFIFSCILNVGINYKSSADNAIPTPDHVVVVILENHGYSQIIGSSAAPHINALAADAHSALFTHSYAIEHPSQPNYLDFYAGCNQGVTNDNVPTGTPFSTANLGSQLIQTGKTFVTYSEDLPSVGYNGATSGNYARKHNPAANWTGTGTNQIATTTNQPFTAFPASNFTSLPTVCYVVPNMNNDMHNGTDPATITQGDTWVYINLNNYIQWAKTNNSLLILTFDENQGTAGNQVTTIFCGAMVKGGQYSETINHYSILRTIEDMYGLPYACNASTATTISDIWLTNSLKEVVTDNMHLIVYPNPASNLVNFKFNKLNTTSTLLISIKDESGRNAGQYCINKSQELQVSTTSLHDGNYFYTITDGNLMIHSGNFIIKK